VFLNRRGPFEKSRDSQMWPFGFGLGSLSTTSQQSRLLFFFFFFDKNNQGLYLHLDLMQCLGLPLEKREECIRISYYFAFICYMRKESIMVSWSFDISKAKGG
jgi:hypothetical protein